MCHLVADHDRLQMIHDDIQHQRLYLHHLLAQNTPGKLVHLLPNGSVDYSLDIDAVTPPVLDGSGRVFVGVHSDPSRPDAPGRVEAYALEGGALLWSSRVGGLPNDLLVADDGLLYVAVGPAERGDLVAIDRAGGGVVLLVQSLAGVYEMVLATPEEVIVERVGDENPPAHG